MVSARWLIPQEWQLDPTVSEASTYNSMVLEVIPDGFSTSFVIHHRMKISAADLLAGFPTIEIVDCSTNPIPAGTGSTHTTLTGNAALLGVTVNASLTSSIVLAFATPAAGGPGEGAAFQVRITRRPS